MRMVHREFVLEVSFFPRHDFGVEQSLLAVTVPRKNIESIKPHLHEVQNSPWIFLFSSLFVAVQPQLESDVTNQNRGSQSSEVERGSEEFGLQ